MSPRLSDGLQRCAIHIHANPMILERQVRIYGHRRHMTAGAIGGLLVLADLFGQGCVSIMTARAYLTVVGRVVPSKFFMRIMARQTRQRAIAFPKALALLEIWGLMTHVPRIIPIYCSSIPVRETMTHSTRSIEFSRGERFRALDQLPGLRQIATADSHQMGIPGSVTDFAAHARFGDPDFVVWGHRHGARRMALKAVSNRNSGTLGPEGLTHCLVQCFRREAFVLWRDIERLRI